MERDVPLSVYRSKCGSSLNVATNFVLNEPRKPQGGDMRTTASALVGILLIATPAASHERPGAFVGARLQLPLGGQHSRQPRAALAAAPTHSRLSDRGMVQTRIGEVIALNLTPGARPTLTLAGVGRTARLASGTKVNRVPTTNCESRPAAG